MAGKEQKERPSFTPRPMKKTKSHATSIPVDNVRPGGLKKSTPI